MLYVLIMKIIKIVWTKILKARKEGHILNYTFNVTNEYELNLTLNLGHLWSCPGVCVCQGWEWE